MGNRNIPRRPGRVGTLGFGAPISLESKLDRTPAGAAATPSSGPGAYLGSAWNGPSDGQRDRQGRAGVRNGAVRRAGPGLLNRSWDQIRASPGAGAGVGPAGGRAGPGRAAPSLLSSRAKLCVNGGLGGGPGGQGGVCVWGGFDQWERGARARAVGIGETQTGWGVGGSGAEPRQETQGRAQHAKTETQTGSRERETKRRSVKR